MPRLCKQNNEIPSDAAHPNDQVIECKVFFKTGGGIRVLRLLRIIRKHLLGLEVRKCCTPLRQTKSG